MAIDGIVEYQGSKESQGEERGRDREKKRKRSPSDINKPGIGTNLLVEAVGWISMNRVNAQPTCPGRSAVAHSGFVVCVQQLVWNCWTTCHRGNKIRLVWKSTELIQERIDLDRLVG